MENLELLRKEMRSADLDGLVNIRNVILWQGYKKTLQSFTYQGKG